MEISFQNKKVCRYCLVEQTCIKRFGKELFNVLKTRLADISAATFLTRLPHANLHELRADREGQFSIKLYKSYKLVLKPSYPNKLVNNRSINWNLVDSVTILEILDCYD